MERELQATDYYAAILADMEARRVALDAAIAGLRAAIAAGILGPIGELQTSAAAVNGTSAPAGMSDLPRGAFLGKTAREAIRLYLGTIRKKQTNKEISKALREGGLESTGDFDKYITSALFRLKEDGDLLRFEDGWGLSEWYNEAFRAKVGAATGSKKPARRAKHKPKKPAKKGPQAAPAILALPAPRETASQRPEIKENQPGELDRRIEDFLDSVNPHGLTIREVAMSVGVPVGTANFSVVRLAKKGFAKRGEDGKIYSTKEHV